MFLVRLAQVCRKAYIIVDALSLMEQHEEAVLRLKQQVEDTSLSPADRINLLNDTLKRFLNMAAAPKDGGMLTRFKSLLYQSGILSHCVTLLTLDLQKLQSNCKAAVTLASLTSSCCVGVEPGELSETFHRLFLPSVMDGLLSLASRLARRAECVSLFRRVMDSVSWLLRAHAQLTTQVLSSSYYALIQGCDEVTMSLLFVQMWINLCTASSDFLSSLSDDAILLLLNEAVGQFAVTSDASLGGASVRLILHMANQLPLQPFLFNFKGLDSLLDKDWRGRGFDQEVDQLIALTQSREILPSVDRVRAACVIQAAWKSYLTRRRLKCLSGVVSMLQRRFRALRRQQQQQRDAQRLQEELNFQVCLQRQQARRKFHQKQRELLQLLPPDQVQPYLLECQVRAAVLIQSAWRGFLARRRIDSQRDSLRLEHAQQHAARTLQRAVRRFLQERQAAKVLASGPCWIGHKGLTDSRRAVLKRQSSAVSRQQCEQLHNDVQWRLQALLQQAVQQKREEQKIESLLAHTHTQLDRLKDAPSLSAVMATDIKSFLSPSGTIATRGRDAHNSRLQAHRLPWWRTLGETASVLNPKEEMELGGEVRS
ncbi:IQ calmodulin-binding motif-containing protein 1-like isoform X2 [Phyllopteryx taeniolatus]|uniref:IQ calmodulin-binding motif-containing protein 1-like isoform X2 n=1 Tax=Phyllopteryx taeniolatus TaxID=161469 RepID=UPI002AD30686|nr:IQ calmodulin-binding motif-containing protein 1-like isoform X2 [Phyllopteryx taeniolatus]